MQNQLVSSVVELLEIEKRKKEKMQFERQKTEERKKAMKNLERIEEEGRKINQSQNQIQNESTNNGNGNGNMIVNTFQKITPQMINLQRQKQKIRIITRQKSKENYQHVNDTQLVSHEDSESTLNSPATIFSKRNFQGGSLFRDGTVIKLFQNDTSSLLNSVVSSFKRIDLEETQNAAPAQQATVQQNQTVKQEQSISYNKQPKIENERLQKLREDPFYLETAKKLMPILQQFFSSPNQYFIKYPKKNNWRIVQQGSDFERTEVEEVIIVCSQCIDQVDSNLSVCSDMLKRTLDDQFEKEWTAIIISIDKARRKASKVVSEKRLLQFSANYSLDKKQDLKLMFSETLYINLYRTKPISRLSSSDCTTFNSSKIKINYVGKNIINFKLFFCRKWFQQILFSNYHISS